MSNQTNDNIKGVSAPILSICIPTYNRSFYLKDCLKDLCDQFIKNPELSDDVEIIISDNDSMDDTHGIVSEYRKRFKNIRYFKTIKNLGFDLNVVNAVEKAGGKYCMYLGDDDAIAIGGVKFLTDYLKDKEISVLTFEITDYSNLKKSGMTNATINDNLIYVTNSHDDFFRKGYSEGVFSNFIFNKMLWLENVNVNDFITGWLYYDVIVKMSSVAKHPLIHISYPITYAKQGCLWNKNGGEFFAFITYKKLVERWLAYDYDKNIFNEILVGMPKRLIIILLRAKGHDLKTSYKNMKILYDEFHNDFSYFMMATIIFYIPNWIVKLMRDFNKKFTRIKT